jgi:hypothetical protein
MGAFHRVLWIDLVRAVLRRQVANDRIGLAQHGAIVDDGRDKADRIDTEEFRGRRGHVTAAPILALEGDVELIANPQHLPDVEGVRPTQNFQHRLLPGH